MICTVVLMTVMVASGQAAKLPEGQEVLEQQLDQLSVAQVDSIFVDEILSGITPMELFKEIDVDNNGCVDFHEILIWISSHISNNHINYVNPIAMVAKQYQLATNVGFWKQMYPMFAKAMEKMIKQGLFDGHGMKAIFVKIVGQEDGCFTFDQWRQWAGL